jgi:hypothetical protein
MNVFWAVEHIARKGESTARGAEVEHSHLRGCPQAVHANLLPVERLRLKCFLQPRLLDEIDIDEGEGARSDLVDEIQVSKCRK